MIYRDHQDNPLCVPCAIKIDNARRFLLSHRRTDPGREEQLRRTAIEAETCLLLGLGEEKKARQLWNTAGYDRQEFPRAPSNHNKLAGHMQEIRKAYQDYLDTLVLSERDEDDDPPCTGEIFYEGPETPCSRCGGMIQSQYGDTEEAHTS
jgi:hypothetical protein